jgi:hypothetical protein
MTLFPGQFAPFNRRAEPQRHRDVNHQDDDDGGADDIANAAEFVRQSYREAGGQAPAGSDRTTAKAEAALAKATSYEERVTASAALIRSFVK